MLSSFSTLDVCPSKFLRAPRGDTEIPPYIEKVKSIDNTIDKVVKNGGKQILAKVPIADFAYMAQINDSEGNLISLWEDNL